MRDEYTNEMVMSGLICSAIIGAVIMAASIFLPAARFYYTQHVVANHSSDVSNNTSSV